ncbi:major facilitator superfamily domain-containing protein [Melampsora americana]|nr:major facilitator superfamily domain-containing protein [Melampsora americana]
MPNRNDGTYVRHFDEGDWVSRDEHQNDLNELHYEALERSTIRMIDLTILPIITMFSMLNFLDRVSIGNLRVIGFQQDLNVSDIQIAIALTAGIISAIELPSNLVLRKVGAGVLLPLLICCFGVVTFCSGFLTDFEGLVAARFVMASIFPHNRGVFPGTMLYLSSFYTRKELQLRIAIVQAAACFSGGISGLLTYGIYRIDGFLGKPGWSWVYFIEGLITILFGLLGLVLLPSTPEESRFLTAAQKKIVYQRIQNDSGGAALKQIIERASAHQIIQALKSPHVVLLCMCSFLACTNMYGVAYFQPIGEQLVEVCPLCSYAPVIPHLSTFLVMLGTSYISDRYSLRGATALLCAGLSLIGYTAFYCLDDWGQRYGTLFISMAGAYATQLPLVTWMSNNTEPYVRRATALAFYAISGNLGGLMSVWVFAYADKPQYLDSDDNAAVGIILLTSINWTYLKHRNKRKLAERENILTGYKFDVKGHVDPQAVERLERVAWERLGDRHPDFKYVL